MDIVENIKSKLDEYPELAYEVREGGITIFAGDQAGFDVTLYRDDKEIVVFFDGWHEHFGASDEEEALSCVAAGLSGHARIKATGRGGKDYKWSLYIFDPETDEWIFSGTIMEFRLIKFWKKKHVRILRNPEISIDLKRWLNGGSSRCAREQ